MESWVDQFLINKPIQMLPAVQNLCTTVFLHNLPPFQNMCVPLQRHFHIKCKLVHLYHLFFLGNRRRRIAPIMLFIRGNHDILEKYDFLGGVHQNMVVDITPAPYYDTDI